MIDLFLAPPWWLLATLALVGVALAWTGLQGNKTAQRSVGLGLIGLALVMLVVGRFYETDKEKCSRLSRELVQSVEQRDWPKMTSLLEPSASLGTEHLAICPNAKVLVETAKADVDRYGLKAVRINSMDVTEDAAGVVVDINVTTDQDISNQTGYGVPSSWRFDWDRTGKEWRVRRITCLKIGTGNQGPIEQFIAK